MDDVVIALPSVSRVAREGSLEIPRKKLCRPAGDGAHQLIFGTLVARASPRQHPRCRHFAAQIPSWIGEYRDLDPNAQTLVGVVELFDSYGEKVPFELPLRDNRLGGFRGLGLGCELVEPPLLELRADRVAHQLVDFVGATRGMVGDVRDRHVVLGSRREPWRGARLASAAPQ